MARPTSARTFQRKEVDLKQLTSERIERDLQAFRQAGGRIEVLGVTQTLKKVGQAHDPSVPARPSAGTRRGASR